MWPPPGSCIKASRLMQPVAASPKGDLNTGVLLYLYVNRIKKLHLSEQCVVLNFCKITEPRKNQLKIEIKHI